MEKQLHESRAVHRLLERETSVAAYVARRERGNESAVRQNGTVLMTERHVRENSVCRYRRFFVFVSVSSKGIYGFGLAVRCSALCS